MEAFVDKYKKAIGAFLSAFVTFYIGLGLVFGFNTEYIEKVLSPEFITTATTTSGAIAGIVYQLRNEG